MKRIYSFLILSVILVAVTVTITLAQKPKTTSMESRWKKVEQLTGQDLPESALKEVEAILAQAKKEQNSPEIIKAMVHKMRFILDKNPDESEKLIGEFEDYADNTTNAAEKAIMHSMSAELYLKYYQNDRYKINQRTELQGYVPEDMKEWTKNIFVDKIVGLAELSLEKPEILQNISSVTYAAILEQGKDSHDMQPTLFDFLSYRKIELLMNFTENGSDDDFPEDDIEFTSSNQEAITADNQLTIHSRILDTYNQLILFNKKQNNTPATVYAELQKLDFETETNDEKYLKELEKLEKQYTGNESVVEVLAAKAAYFLSKNN